MAEKISITKGFDNDTFDTYVPELSDNADIQNAFELFYYGDSTDGNTTGDVSLHANLVNFDTRITSATSGLSGHTGAISDVHGVGAGNEVVGTGKSQTLTNKTLTTPKINENVNLTATSTELNVLDGITASTAELNIMNGVTASTTELNYVDGVTSAIQTQINTKSPSASPTFTGTVVLPSTTSIGNVSSTEIGYVDGVTSAIQTQINTNTPTGMISIHAGASAPTGWLLCDGTSYASASYTALFSVIGYTFGGSGANFNVPNLKGKVVAGIDGAQTEFNVRGETGGTMTHQHAASNSASASTAHNHSIDPPNTGTSENGAAHYHGTNSHAHNYNPPTTTTSGPSSEYSLASGSYWAARGTHTHTLNIGEEGTNAAAPNTGNADVNHSHTVDIGAFATTGGEGGSHTHTTPASDSPSNLQPYMALNYIVKH